MRAGLAIGSADALGDQSHCVRVDASRVVPKDADRGRLLQAWSYAHVKHLGEPRVSVAFRRVEAGGPHARRAKGGTRMRRLFAVIAALVLTAALGAPATADTAGGCLGPGQCRMTGQGVDAFWSGVPEGGPVPGGIYTDTYLNAGMGTFSGGGERSTNGWASFDEWTYTFDANGNYIALADTNGFGTLPDISISVARALGSATLSGSVQAISCTFDGSGNETCGTPFPTSVHGTWTATGARLRSVFTSHESGGGSSYTTTFNGMTRLGTATVTIGGVAPTGLIAGADINDSQGNTVSICHGPTC